MRIREIKYADIDSKSSFSPIREIILFDDEKWEKFLTDDSPMNLGAVEGLFSINEIFPSGLSYPFSHELGKFLATLDTFQCTLTLLYSLTEDVDFKNILHDFRITIQNFQIFLEVKSYYSAFIEFRKMLEGILWMDYMVKNDSIPENITKWEYGEKLRELDVSFAEAYSEFNAIFHYSKKTPFIHVNKYYNEPDLLYSLLKVIDDISDIYELELQKFTNFFSNKSMRRYQEILRKLYKARAIYNLENKPIATSGLDTFEEGQNDFEALLVRFHLYKFKSFKLGYENGIRKLGNKQIKLPSYKTLDVVFLHMVKNYGDTFIKYEQVLDNRSQNDYSSFKEYLRINNPKSETFKQAMDICTLLLEKEIKSKGDRTIAFMRAIMEDICFNASHGKTISYAHTRILSEILKKKFSIWIKPMPYKFSHLLRDDRPVYLIKNASFEQLEAQKRLKKEFIKYLEEFSTAIKNLSSG